MANYYSSNLKRGLLLGIFSAVCLFSCERPQTSLTPAEDQHFVSLADAALVADTPEKTLSLDGYYSRKRIATNARLAARQITSSFSLATKGIPYVHVFNYNNGGFVVIAADDRLYPILAWSDEGNFQFEGVPSNNGLWWWATKTKQYTEAIRDGKLAADPNAASGWAAYRNSGARVSGATPPTDPGGCSEQTYSVGPLLTTSWGQGCVFNYSIDSGNEPNNCYHKLVGCNGVAMAQLMNYYQYPSSHNGTTFNWSNMPNGFPTSSPSPTSVLMRSLGDAVGTVYSDVESTAYPSNIPSVFTSYGYQSSSFSSYSYNAVVAELSHLRPVLLVGFEATTGKGHTWVADGYMQVRQASCNVVQYLSLNWGWNGSSNGNYYQNFQPTGSSENYGTNNYMITVLK